MNVQEVEFNVLYIEKYQKYGVNSKYLYMSDIEKLQGDC